MGRYYRVSFESSDSDYLAHYGTPGMKWGIRRFRNEDGSLTSEGRARYGVGDPRRPGVVAGLAAQKQAEHNYRVKRFGSASAKTLEKKPKQLSKKEQQIRKTRAKRLLATAAIVGVGVAALYGMHRYKKTTDNLIQLAKNEVDKTYKMGEGSLKNAQDRANHAYWRAHDMSAITTRKAAKKVLLLNNREQTKHFIKANKIAKLRTSDIIEQRTGKLVEGVHKNRLKKRFDPISERKRRKMVRTLIGNARYYT